MTSLPPTPSHDPVLLHTHSFFPLSIRFLIVLNFRISWGFSLAIMLNMTHDFISQPVQSVAVSVGKESLLGVITVFVMLGFFIVLWLFS